MLDIIFYKQLTSKLSQLTLSLLPNFQNGLDRISIFRGGYWKRGGDFFLGGGGWGGGGGGVGGVSFYLKYKLKFKVSNDKKKFINKCFSEVH